MAATQSIPVFNAEFPQTFTSWFTEQIAITDNLLAIPRLGQCQRDIPLNYQYTQVMECSAKATVFDLETEMEYCAQCFREVTRG